MSKKLLSTLIASLFASAPALAQTGDWNLTGSVGVGVLMSSTDNHKDPSKFTEYRDLEDGALGVVDVRGRGATTWFDLFMENLFRDDAYASLRGGQYGVWKGRVYTDWLRHRFVDNARSPFEGVGSDRLTATFPRADVASWKQFDMNYTRKDTGGFFEWQSLSPWYFRVDGNVVKWEGTKPGASSNGTSPGNGFMDLPFPVDYRTENAALEAGYITKAMHVAVQWQTSRFKNDMETLRWNNPFFANGVDTTFMPPDNKYNRIAANATFRQLPWNSTVAARFTWDKLESDVGLPLTALSTGGAFGATNPNVASFDGRVENQTFTVAWAAMPIANLDTRVYYNYQNRDNESTQLEFAAVAGLNCGGQPCHNELFHYRKHNVGFDAYYRVNRGNRVGGGIDYWNMERERVDYDNTRDTKLFLEWKNTQLDNLSARVKYTYLQRRSDFLEGDAGVNANDVNFINRFIARYDAADLDRNEIKLIVDWSPMPLLDLSLEASYKDNDYKNTVLGRTKDTRDEVYLAAYYGDPNVFRVTVYGDVENIKYDSFHRNIGAGSCPTNIPAAQGGGVATNCFDPSTPPNPIAYNWEATNKDRNWSAGIGFDWPAMDRLMVKGAYLYYKTDGSSDIVSQNNFGNPLPIRSYDDSKRHSFNLKGIYAVNKNWSVTGGYAYEKWQYSDIRFDGYQYTIPFPAVTNSTSQSYLSGWNAFTPYKANIFYGMVTYKF